MLNEEGNGWDSDKLTQLFGDFGHEKCLEIRTSIRPPTEGAGQHPLIFIHNTNEQFTVKKAYNRLRCEGGVDGTPVDRRDPFWDVIRAKGQVLPRVRLCLWKLINGALPLGKTLLRKTSGGDPIRATRVQMEEDEGHIIFTCLFAESCWFAGSLALRTKEINENIKVSVKWLASQMGDEDWLIIANSIWAIWRCGDVRFMAANHLQSTCS